MDENNWQVAVDAKVMANQKANEVMHGLQNTQPGRGSIALKFAQKWDEIAASGATEERIQERFTALEDVKSRFEAMEKRWYELYYASSNPPASLYDKHRKAVEDAKTLPFTTAKFDAVEEVIDGWNEYMAKAVLFINYNNVFYDWLTTFSQLIDNV
jgi:hypothetical protein